VKLGEIATQLQLRLEGGPDLVIRGLANLDDAGPEDLSFVTGPRYRRAFERSRGGAFLVPRDFDSLGRPCLRSGAPYADFARAIDLLLPPSHAPSPGIHPTAVVAPDSEIGTDVSIGPYVVVGPRARIGNRSVLHPHVVLYADVVIGEECVVHSGVHLREGVQLGKRVVIENGAVLGPQGFGYAFREDGTRIRVPHRCAVDVGDDSDIGANTTIDASHPGQSRYGHPVTRTWVGRAVKIDNLVQIGHGCSVGDGSTICAQTGLAGSTEVGRSVLFAGQASSGGHLKIGDGAMVGGKTGVSSDLEPGAQVLGTPHMERRRWGRAVTIFKQLPELLQRVRRIESLLGVKPEKPHD
jgi:UDP-3-O-[3-hydroxymyristoyl] glucosamine N-acyltransferase